MRLFVRHLAGFALVVGLLGGLAAPALAGGSAERVLVSERSAQVVQTAKVVRETRWIWPVSGSISSGYGPRGGGFHPGVDIGSLRSLAVRSATDGVVLGAGYLAGYEGYGILVLVDIGNGYTLLYGHLSRAAVKAGDVLEQGDPIGTAGCTGRCYGTHLHFELRKNDRWVDITPFLP